MKRDDQRAQPPRLVEGLLLRCLPSGIVGQSIAADLRAEFHEMVEAGQHRSPVRWYCREAFLLAVRYCWTRSALAFRRFAGGWTAAARFSYRRVGTQMDYLIGDLRLGLRRLIRQPGLVLAAIVVLTIGIGCTSTVLTFSYNFLRLQVEIPQSEDVYFLGARYGSAAQKRVPLTKLRWGRLFSFPFFERLRQSEQGFEGLAAFSPRSMTLRSGESTARAAWGEIVSREYFSVLKIQPHLGRFPIVHPDGPIERSLVLEYDTWRTKFGGDESLLGKAVRVNDGSFTVVGVAPPGFKGVNFSHIPEFWLPAAAVLGRSEMENPAPAAFSVVVRTAKGVGRAPLEATLKTVAAAIDRELKYHTLRRVELQPIEKGGIHPRVRNDIGIFSFWMSLLAGIVLAAACFNVLNLLMARWVARKRELAIRSAVGASNARLAFQLLMESLLLGVLAGGAALLLSSLALDLIPPLIPPSEYPLSTDFGAPRGLVWIVAGVTFLAVIGFGLPPALRTLEGRLAGTLNSDSPVLVRPRRPRHLLEGLLVTQVAFAALVLVLFGQKLPSLVALAAFDLGFEPEGVTYFKVIDRNAGYKVGEGFYRLLLSRFRGIAGVESIDVVDHLPIVIDRDMRMVAQGGDPTKEVSVAETQVGNEYFDMMRTEFRSGRAFRRTDVERDERLIILSESVAGRLWPGEAALGREVRDSRRNRTYRVIGVTADGTYGRASSDPLPMVFTSFWQGNFNQATFIVRSRLPAGHLISAIRNQIKDGDVTVFGFNTIKNRTTSFSLRMTILTRIAAMLAISALMISTIGTFALFVHAVVEETPAIGLRLALGADPSQVMRSVVKRGLFLTFVGGSAGCLAAVPLSFIAFKGGGPEPWVFLLVALLLGLCSLASTYLPACRASRVDPLVALQVC